MTIAVKDKYRAINYVSTAQTAGNIDSFGIELASLYSGKVFLVCNEAGIGRAFLAYSVEDKIVVDGIYAESAINSGKNALIGSLIASLINIGASLKKPIEIKLDEDSRAYIDFANDLYKKGDIEEVYRWKIQG